MALYLIISPSKVIIYLRSWRVPALPKILNHFRHSLGQTGFIVGFRLFAYCMLALLILLISLHISKLYLILHINIKMVINIYRDNIVLIWLEVKINTMSWLRHVDSASYRIRGRWTAIQHKIRAYSALPENRTEADCPRRIYSTENMLLNEVSDLNIRYLLIEEFAVLWYFGSLSNVL